MGGARKRSGLAVEAQQAVGAAPGVGYGMTETNAIGTVNGGSECLARPDSAGRAMPLVTLKVADEGGVEPPPGREGEIWIKSAASMRGYWKRAGETTRTLTGGWLRTGDLGYIDEGEPLPRLASGKFDIQALKSQHEPTRKSA